MKMLDYSVREFLDKLGSKESVPGGGAAAALTGSIGASLGLMVGSYTLGRKGYEDVQPEIENLMKELGKIEKNLAECVDLDAEAFAPLSKAYKIPKDSPERDEVMEKCLRDAAAVPLRVMELCAEAIEFLKRFEAAGYKPVVSDAATGASLCRAGLLGAAVNVRVNTKMMKDRQYAAAVDAEAAALVRVIMAGEAVSSD